MQERARLKITPDNSKTSLCRLVAVCLVACLSLLQASADGLPNFHQVSAGIYRGAAPTSAGLVKLRSLGVRTILDLRIAPKTVRKEKKEAERLGMRWVNVPMGSDPPTTKQVDTLLSTLKRAPQEPVFVHCQHGADRTGCMIGIWRVTQQRWSYPQAYAEMRRYGFKPYLHSMADAVKARSLSAHSR